MRKLQDQVHDLKREVEYLSGTIVRLLNILVESGLKIDKEEVLKDSVEPQVSGADVAKAIQEANEADSAWGGELEEIETSMELQGDQPAAFSTLMHWVQDAQASPWAVLAGTAGSGKSTLVKYLYFELRRRGFDVVLTATTNQAANNLARIIGISSSEVSTIHSFLGLVMVEEEGELILKAGPYSKVNQCKRNTIVVVDEAGMLNTAMVQEHIAVIRNLKILGVGDPYQLPPVGEESSPYFKFVRENGVRVFMKKVLRFGDEKLDLSVLIRAKLQAKDYRLPNIEEVGSIKLLSNEDSVVSRYRAMYEAANDKKDFISGTKILVRKNTTAHKYCSRIREEVLNLGEELYYPGESLLVARPIVNEKGDIVASIDSRLYVTQVDKGYALVDTCNGEVSIEVYLLEVEGDYAGVIQVAENPEELKSVLDKEARVAKGCKDKESRKIAWSKFWKIQNKFVEVRYAYSITNHRAQGCTLENAIVDLDDVWMNSSPRQSLRAVYVGVTRPQRLLYLKC